MQASSWLIAEASFMWKQISRFSFIPLCATHGSDSSPGVVGKKAPKKRHQKVSRDSKKQTIFLFCNPSDCLLFTTFFFRINITFPCSRLEFRHRVRDTTTNVFGFWMSRDAELQNKVWLGSDVTDNWHWRCLRSSRTITNRITISTHFGTSRDSK